MTMGGHQVPCQGSGDDGYDEDGYDESQRAEILEVTGDGPTDGIILTDLSPDIANEDDDDDLEMEEGDLGDDDDEDEADPDDDDEDDVQDALDSDDVDEDSLSDADEVALRP